MGVADFVIAPIYILLLTIIAYVLRPFLTDKNTRKYFLPALWIRCFGAISVGLIYQFYYGGGDTYMYYHLGTRFIWEAFLESPLLAIKLIVSGMDYSPDGFYYQSQIYTYGDSASYFVVRIGGFFSLLTFNNYSGIALLFAFTGFLGCWALFQGFYKIYPSLVKYFALGILFLPSIFFWGSGLLKDTLTLSALGFLFYSLTEIVIWRKRVVLNAVVILIMTWVIYVVKIYIILSFIPAVFVWLYFQFQKSINSTFLRYALAPVLLMILAFSGFLAVQTLSSESRRYSLDKVLITAEETAKWNYYVSEQQGGSGYSLGDYDFSPSGLARKFVPATLTAIFRPTIIEARNPVMILTALENLVISILILLSLTKLKPKLFQSNPILMLAIVFVILFSFSVGVTTYNFGALSRYRIPMLPFLTSVLIIIRYYGRSEGR